MNAKERFYSGLAKETIGKITSNTDNWTSFLRTMSRNYEFTYPEQVMIYAQRPNATFCKPYEDWNAENYRRYVKRGSTGIALFVMNRDKPYLRYVFDVADTGVRRSSPELKPWEVTPENRSYVMEAMERTFGVAADGVLEAQLEDIASALAAEYWDDYKKQFLDIVANSFLEEYDELNIEVAFKNAVANSVSYTMYCRFVESPDNYFEHEDFQKVFDFNTRQTVNALGTAVNAISTRMFQEIEKAIGEHAFKNLFLYTKMRNVAGLSTSEAQKSSDMFMKCRYMDELTGGRGVIFATGTPVSNSMTELYTVMRYLQYSTLQQKNLTHFDSWASTFGETTTAIELAPEGTGYRARTRFAKFFNLPELMNMFKEVADIKTSDQLHLPVPEAKFETVVVQPSEYQKDMVASLSERAADVHAGIVDPSVDNMLKITSDGRKLGLDQRLMNTLLPDDPDSKLNACVGNILRIWQDGQADKLTQLVFCDLSTPKNDGTFNVYDDVKTKLIANGVPAEEVAFIHDADTEAKKKDLFAKVRTGQVRVLLGSTQKMGAGTNVQDKLVAVHHLDVGWRPSDMTQRNGRIIRQGNRNKEVQVYQYVTEGTFDAYLYQTLENKQKFISQIMTSKSPVRSCDDVDEQALSYAEIKALCAGNPLIKEKMDLDIDVARLKVLKADHQSQQYRMEDKLLKYFPAEIEKQTGYIHGFEADIKTVEAHPQIADGFCGMEIMGKAYTEKADAGEILLAACKDTKSADPVPLGSYRGFQMELSFDSFRNEFDVTLKGAVSHRVALGTDARGNITRLDNALAGILERLERANEQLNNLYNQQEAAKAEVGKPFPQEAELTAKSQRLAELDAALNMEDSVENRDERSESERPSVLADLKSKAEHIPPAKYSETREEVL